MAYDHYASELNPTIYQQLGVSKDTVLGFTQQTIDCSYLNATGEWLDVSEYGYSLQEHGRQDLFAREDLCQREHPAGDRRRCLAAVLQQRHRRRLLSTATFLSTQRQWTILCLTNRFHLFQYWGSSTGSWVKNILDEDAEDTLATYELARDGIIIEVFDLVSPAEDGRNRFAISFDEIDAIRPMTPEENRQYYASLVSNTMRVVPLRAKIASDENDYESGKIKQAIILFHADR